MFYTHGKQLGVRQQLPGLPDYNRQTFPNEFIDYCRSQEWLEYERETVSCGYLTLLQLLCSSFLQLSPSHTTHSPSHTTHSPSQLRTEVAHYSTVLLPWLQMQSNHAQDCHLLYLQNERLRKAAVCQEQSTYQVAHTLTFTHTSPAHLTPSPSHTHTTTHVHPPTQYPDV